MVSRTSITYAVRVGLRITRSKTVTIAYDFGGNYRGMRVGQGCDEDQ